MTDIWNTTPEEEEILNSMYSTEHDRTADMKCCRQDGSCGTKKENPTYESDNVENDAVNHPAHYCRGGIECIDALRSMTFGMTGFAAFCAANAVKYIWRHCWKGKPVEDLKKARFYIDRLIAHYESEEQ